MKRLLRAVLTWLLLVAVPLQGYAAWTMLLCGVSQGQAGSAVVDHSDHVRAGHAHDTSAHHDGDSADERSSPAITLADLAHGACSVCASCCSGVALPAATITVSYAQQQQWLPLPTEYPAPAHAPTRLERPPRTALA